MQSMQGEAHKRYTYADFMKWDDGNRYELVDGMLYMDGQVFAGIPGRTTMMAPPPSRRHQAISGEIHNQLYNFLKGKPCDVYAAPFGVRLNAKNRDDSVLQPDIVVVCDRAKLDDRGCNGAPDMVIEILSPATSRHDRIVKFNKYLQAGVREYWIVDPMDRAVSVHVLKNGEYVTSGYGDSGQVAAHVLDGFHLSLPDVFAE